MQSVPKHRRYLELDGEQLKETLRRVKTSLDPESYRLLRAVAESYFCMTGVLESQDRELADLRKRFLKARRKKLRERQGRSR